MNKLIFYKENPWEKNTDFSLIINQQKIKLQKK
jgi:hypothetical protein